ARLGSHPRVGPGGGPRKHFLCAQESPSTMRRCLWRDVQCTLPATLGNAPSRSRHVSVTVCYRMFRPAPEPEGSVTRRFTPGVSRLQVSGENVPVASTTPRVPLTLQGLSPALVPAGGASSGRSSSDPSASSAKIVTPLGST